LIHVGRQTGLLEQLSSCPLTLEELIFRTGLYAPAVEAWCSATLAYGFIVKRKGKLQLKKHMHELLIDRMNPKYLGGQFSYLALRSQEYSAFEHLFRSGKTIRNAPFSFALSAVEQATDWDHYAFLAAVRRRRKLSQLLSKGCRVLDVGCGTGSLLTKVNREYPQSTLVGIDPSEQAVIAARRIASGSTITVMKQKAESMRFRNEFEIVYLGETLYAANDKSKVVSNCWQALKKDGIIAIVEGLLPESRFQNDTSRLIMGMQLDFALEGHKFMTKREITVLLKSRFSSIRFESLGGRVYLVTAAK
jgi:SAM-dependent methyltransferase